MSRFTQGLTTLSLSTPKFSFYDSDYATDVGTLGYCLQLPEQLTERHHETLSTCPVSQRCRKKLQGRGSLQKKIAHVSACQVVCIPSAGETRFFEGYFGALKRI